MKFDPSRVKIVKYTQAGFRYAKLIGGGADAAGPIIARFFGIFFTFLQSSFIWGMLTSSLGWY